MILAINIVAPEGHILTAEAVRTIDGKPFGSTFQIVRPEGWSLPPGFPITTQRAERFGIGQRYALRLILEMVRTVRLIVAHGLDPQAAIIASAMRDPEWIGPGVRRVCIAQASGCTDLDAARAAHGIEQTGAAAVLALYSTLKSKGTIE